MVTQNRPFAEDSRGQLLIGATAILIIGLLLLGAIINGGLFIEAQMTQPAPDNEYRGELIQTAYDEYSSAMYIAEQNGDSQTAIESELNELGKTIEEMWRITYVGTYEIERDSTTTGERISQTSPDSLSTLTADSYSIGTADRVRRIELRPQTTNLTETTPENVTGNSDVFHIEWESGNDQYTTYLYENTNTGNATVQTTYKGDTIHREPYTDGVKMELITGSINGASAYTTPTEFDGGSVTVRITDGDAVETEFFAVVDPIGGNTIQGPASAIRDTTIYESTFTVRETTPQDTTTYTMSVKPCHIGEQACSYP